MSHYKSTKVIELGSCAFRQWQADPRHATKGLAREGNSCYKLHGYQLKAKFIFGCSELDERNWCVDYGSLKGLKAILNKQFDHTTTIASTDPALPLFQQLHDAGACDLRIMDGVGVEKVAEFCFNAASQYIQEHYGDRCWVEQVEVFEHEANSSIYSKSNRATNQAQPIIDIPTSATSAVTHSEVILPQRTPTPAHVGPNNSSGKGDWFKGTSWG